MTEGDFQIARIMGLALTAGIALVLQRAVPHDTNPGSWRVNGCLWALNGLMLATVCGACACSVAQWASTAGIGALNVLNVPFWAKLCVAVIALDLVSFAWHRANHRIELLWRFHRVHHSDLAFTVSTGVRFHPGELLFSLPVRLLAVALIGAPVLGILVFEVTFNLANLVGHGNISLPLRFERHMGWLFITPALHRRHHTRRRPDLDSNFGTIFSAWDRLFGTFGFSSSAARIETGLPDQHDPLQVLGALSLPFQLRPAKK